MDMTRLSNWLYRRVIYDMPAGNEIVRVPVHGMYLIEAQWLLDRTAGIWAARNVVCGGVEQAEQAEEEEEEVQRDKR